MRLPGRVGIEIMDAHARFLPRKEQDFNAEDAEDTRWSQRVVKNIFLPPRPLRILRVLRVKKTSPLPSAAILNRYRCDGLDLASFCRPSRSRRGTRTRRRRGARALCRGGWRG